MKIFILIFAFILVLSGCAPEDPVLSGSSVLENPVITEPSESEEPTAEEIPENSIFTANATYLPDCNNVKFSEDKVFQSVSETGGSLYIVSEHIDNCVTKNDEVRIGPASLYYRTPLGKTYFLTDLPTYDYQDPRISFVHLTENIYSLCTPEKIMFFALNSNMQIDFTLDFQKTDHRFHGFNCVTYDEESETYLLIFSVSDYESEDKNISVLSHKIWNDESSKLCFQRFSSDGSYIDTVETDIKLNYLNTLSACVPNNYTGNTIEFFRKGGDYRVDESYYHYDFESKELISRPARDLFILDDFVVLRSEWEYIEKQNLYETSYSLLEHGKEKSVLKICSELDFHISEPNYGYNFPSFMAMDSADKTLELHYGRAVHSLDFKNEHAKFSYDYSGLDPEIAFAKSPDGKYELYSIGNAGRGDEYVSVAAKNTKTGEFSYIGEHCFWSYNQAISNEHRLFFRSLKGIEYVDIPTKENGILINYATVGEEYLCEAYDIENEVIIIASIVDLYDDPKFDISYETVKLQIFDFDGNLINVIRTDIIPYYSGKAYGAYLNDMNVNPDGTVTFYDFYGTVDPSGKVTELKEPKIVQYKE